MTYFHNKKKKQLIIYNQAFKSYQRPVEHVSPSATIKAAVSCAVIDFKHTSSPSRAGKHSSETDFTQHERLHPDTGKLV